MATKQLPKKNYMKVVKWPRQHPDFMAAKKSFYQQPRKP